MTDWMKGFDALNRALLAHQDDTGLVSSSEVARLITNFDLIYHLNLPKDVVVDLLQTLETPDYKVHAQEYCRALLESLQAQ